jgi:hypothetical protein
MEEAGSEFLLKHAHLQRQPRNLLDFPRFGPASEAEANLVSAERDALRRRKCVLLAVTNMSARVAASDAFVAPVLARWPRTTTHEPRRASGGDRPDHRGGWGVTGQKRRGVRPVVAGASGSRGECGRLPGSIGTTRPEEVSPGGHRDYCMDALLLAVEGHRALVKAWKTAWPDKLSCRRSVRKK